MHYLFAEEDLRNLPKTDELWIQRRYAEQLGKCMTLTLLNLSDFKRVAHAAGGESVLVRATCENAPATISLLESQRANLTESASDVELIKHWPTIEMTKRPVVCATMSFSQPGELLPLARQLTEGTLSARLFLKTLAKGFTVDFSAEEYIDDPEPVDTFIEMMCCHKRTDVIVSPFMDIAEDALGKLEARFFVFDGVVANGSRYVHSLAHSVDAALCDYASSVVARVGEIPDFPKNYVVDVCRCANGVCDVVEFNPVSMSLCYANNSIFHTEYPDKTIGCDLGAEFLFDRKRYPSDYHDVPAPGFSFVYEGHNHYSL